MRPLRDPPTALMQLLNYELTSRRGRSWEPHFTFYLFQCIEQTCLPMAPGPEAVGCRPLRHAANAGHRGALQFCEIFSSLPLPCGERKLRGVVLLSLAVR